VYIGTIIIYAVILHQIESISILFFRTTAESNIILSTFNGIRNDPVILSIEYDGCANVYATIREKPLWSKYKQTNNNEF